MKTKALRLYGKMDLRLESFDLPEIADDEILAEVISDSICMSSYKAAKQGPDHKRVPDDCAENPVIIGHEFAGKLLKVGAKWADKFKAGDSYGIQPALMYKGSLDAPGYSFKYIGGDATHVIIPKEVMEMDCLLPYSGDAYYMASLAEPLSCVIGAVHAQYHIAPGDFIHEMGIKKASKTAILAGAGPMGMGLIDYLVHGPQKPALVVVTDIAQDRLDRAAEVISPAEAEAHGVTLIYKNTGSGNAVEELNALSDGTGFDDVFVFAPVGPVIEQGDAILGRDGCLNFFAGPTDTEFKAKMNFYDVHYAGTHIVGTSGGRTADLQEALDLMAAGKLDPSMMVTHVGGLTAAKDATLNLPNIPGGKKLIYNQVDLPLVALDDFAELGKTDPLYAELAEICAANKGLWSLAAEKVIMEKAPKL